MDILSATDFAKEALFETLWPTRCALCDAPGSVLCPTCRMNLEYIDIWKACPHCGAPHARLQCPNCTPMENTPNVFAATPARSATSYGQNAARVVKTFKDKGEARLGETMAEIMVDITPLSWLSWAQAVTYIPATKQAHSKRGFDHMLIVATHYAHLCSKHLSPLFLPPASLDQRTLGRAERIQNMQSRFRLKNALPPQRILLLDDVCTTGSTLASAAQTLRQHGSQARIVTFSRV